MLATIAIVDCRCASKEACPRLRALRMRQSPLSYIVHRVVTIAISLSSANEDSWRSPWSTAAFASSSNRSGRLDPIRGSGSVAERLHRRRPLLTLCKCHTASSMGTGLIDHEPAVQGADRERRQIGTLGARPRPQCKSLPQASSCLALWTSCGVVGWGRIASLRSIVPNRSQSRWPAARKL